MITVFGSLMLDLIGRVDRFPVAGETVRGTTFSRSPGGKGANQALAARRAGAAVQIVGAAGNDGMADEALALLKAGGVDLGEVRRLALPQGVAMIFVDPSGENEIAILPGANSETSIADAERTVAKARPGDIVVVQQEIPQEATARALALAKAKGIVSIVNTAPFLPDTAQVVRDAAIVVANETEFALLAGSEPSESVMQNWARERGQTMIVTLGAEGAWAATTETLIKVPALKVTPIDTVGAGDTFVGYLAAGLDAGLDLEAAMRRAAVAASLACLKPGAQPAIPQAAEVEAALSSGSR